LFLVVAAVLFLVVDYVVCGLWLLLLLPTGQNHS